MHKPIFKPWTIPLALLLLIILAFGLLITSLGFYQDDWYLVWMGLRQGPEVYFTFFAGSRPFLALSYILTTSLVGSSMLAWQIFALLTRWLAVLAAWWALRQLWPGHLKEITWIAVLFAIYPAFKQHFVAVVYSNAYLALATFLVSLGIMLRVARQPRWKWPLTILSLLLSAFSLVTTEYFFGLELFRPLLLWFLFSQDNRSGKERLRLTLLNWTPYLAVTLVFLVWRVFFFTSYMYGPALAENLNAQPVVTLFSLFQNLLQDGLEANIFAWTQAFDFARTLYPDLRQMAIAWGIVIGVGLLIGFYLTHLETVHARQKNGSAQKPSLPDHFGWQAVALGIFSILITGWPFWYAGLSIDLVSGADRFTLSYMFGAAILVVGLLDVLVKNDLGKIVIVSLLAGAAVLFQFKNAQAYQYVHQVQAALFRQLTWRAPGLQPGARLLINDPLFDYTGNASMNAALNWVYLPEPRSQQPDYQLLFIPFKIGSPELPSLEAGPHLENSLVAYYQPPGCVQILDPGAHKALPRLSESIQAALPFSDLEMILPDSQAAAKNYSRLFGDPSTSEWCYFFERADLARQLEDWAEIVRLGDLAFNANLEPYDKFSNELLPFIEAYGRLERWEDAIKITRAAMSDVPALQETLCSTWQRINQATPANPSKTAAFEEVQNLLDCSSQ